MHRCPPPVRPSADFHDTGFFPVPRRDVRRWSAPAIVLPFVLLSGLLLAVALGWLRMQTVGSAERLTLALAQVIGEQTARSLQAVDDRLQGAATGIATSRDRAGAHAGDARDILRSETRQLPYVRSMWVLDAQGRRLFDSDPAPEGQSFADREYYTALRDNPAAGFYVAMPVHSRKTGTLMITASRPILDAHGAFAGVVVASLEPSYFERIWRGIDLGAGAAISLLRLDGRLLLRVPLEVSQLGRDLGGTPLMTVVQKQPQGVQRVELDGQERVAAWTAVATAPALVVAVGTPYTHVLAPWSHLAWLSGAGWLLASAAALLLAWRLHGQARRRDRAASAFAQLAQAMPQIVFMTDANGRLRFVNDRWSEITGQPAELARHRGWMQLVHAEDRDQLQRAVRRMFETGQEMDHECRLLHADGTWRWQLMRARPVRDAGGRITAWYGSSTEIDELRRVQDQLHEKTQRLEVASRLTRMGAWELDVATRRIRWSDEAAAILEFPPGVSPTIDEALQLVAPGSLSTTTAALEQCIFGGQLFDIEAEMRTATGRPVWMRSVAHPVRDARGRVVAVQGAMQDITERVRLVAEIQELNFGLEERIAERTRQLRANESALRLANEQLQSYSYSVSHDLQSPLHRIGAFAALLREALPGDAGDRARHFLDRIDANITVMRELIEGLLALSQVSQLEVVTQTVNISRIAMAILEQLQADCPERKVEWSVAPALEARGDARLMRSVMDNLIGNAWKFTRREPNARIEVGGSSDSGVFFVRDNGAGFDTSRADRLFATFQRFHSPDEFEGTGIGLATVARAMERQGGGVRAESAPGQGATIWITLPPVRGADADDVDEVRARAPMAQPRILVVDDNEVNRVVTQGLLEALGYTHIAVAADGEEAVRACERDTFDLVLMDWLMPVMDGLQATKALRLAGHRMPVIAITANALPADREACLAAGMNDVLTKPIEAGLLVRRIERWLRGDPSGSAREPAGHAAARDFDADAVAERFRRDPGLFVQARAIFVRNTPGRLEEIAAAFSAGDDASARRLAHGLRGSAATVGAERLAVLCRQIERGEWLPGREWLPLASASFEAFEGESAIRQ